MSAHNHGEFVEGCYRCDLSRDEVTEYTPTTDEMRDDYVSNLFEGGGSDEARAEWDYERENGEQIFDRWLAAHDAEVRAAALAEQGETAWEYVVCGYNGLGLYLAPTLEAARDGIAKDQARSETKPKRTIMRRRKAGPWMPVEQGTDREIRCDYCGDALPSVKSRAHIPTTPDLQHLGFEASKVVCPECVERVRSTDTTNHERQN